MIILLISILVYLLSIIGWFFIVLHKERQHCYTIGDVFDESELFMYLPFINTVALIAVIIAVIISTVIKALKLDKLWDKIRNTKLR